MRKSTLILLALLFLAACGNSEEPCTSMDYYDAIEPMLEKWDDTVQVAGSTSRIALGAQVARLQDIKREVEDADIPPCGIYANVLLLEAMDYRIDAFLAFMSQEEDDEVSRLSDRANAAIDKWKDALDAIDEVE